MTVSLGTYCRRSLPPIAWSLKALFAAKEEVAIFNLASENDKEIYQTELGAQILPVLFSFVIQSESNQRPGLRRSAPSNQMKLSSNLSSHKHEYVNFLCIKKIPKHIICDRGYLSRCAKSEAALLLGSSSYFL